MSREVNLLKKYVYLLALFAVGYASAQPAQVVTETYAGVPIRLVIPQGYCAIRRDDPLGALSYQFQEEGNKGSNRVALLFSDCKEWAKRVANNSYRVRNHGSYLFQFVRKQEQLAPESYTLEKYIADGLTNSLKTDGITSESSNAKITEAIKKRLEASTIAAPTFDSPLNLGLIDRNDQALFFGLGMTVKYPNEAPRINGVTAMTLVKQVPVSINIYSDHNPKTSFNKLLMQQREVVRKFFDANR